MAIAWKNYYFFLNGVNLSHLVSGLKITSNVAYNAQTNAAGNTVVDMINTKRTITATFIPMNNTDRMALQRALAKFSVNVSILNPNTNELENDIPCIVNTNDAEYYTIQQTKNKILYKETTITFTEL